MRKIGVLFTVLLTTVTACGLDERVSVERSDLCVVEDQNAGLCDDAFHTRQRTVDAAQAATGLTIDAACGEAVGGGRFCYIDMYGIGEAENCTYHGKCRQPNGPNSDVTCEEELICG